MNILGINDLSFEYSELKIFDHFSCNIKKGNWVSLIGPTGSGKSTLVKLISGLLFPKEGTIEIENTPLTKQNLPFIRSKIGVVFSNPNHHFIGATVEEDLVFALENMRLPRKMIQERLDEIIQEFSLESILLCPPSDLSGGEKQLVALASTLITDPSLLILDEAFSMIDPLQKEKLFKHLKTIQKKRNMTIIHITHDMEDTLYGDDIIVLNQGKIVIQDRKINVYEQEKTLKKLGFDLPFLASLSIKLRYYGLVDHILLDMDKLVNHLWK